MAETDSEKGKKINDKGATSFVLHCKIKSEDVLSLGSGLYAGEMITRAV
jgi:hypothetical protein